MTEVVEKSKAGAGQPEKTPNRFKKNFSLEQRVRQFEQVRSLPGCSDRIPVVCEPMPQSEFDTAQYRTNKLLCSSDITMATLLVILRKRLPKLKSHQALFLNVGGKLVGSSELLVNIYEKHKDEEDGFLYVTYCPENTFG